MQVTPINTKLQYASYHREHKMSESFSGGCLCGAVRYQCAVAPVGAGHCHCNDCRKSSGTGHCSHLVVPAAALEVTGKVTFFESPTDAGNTVGRAFCPTCGSPVYSKNSSLPDLLFPRASSLDNLEVFQPQMVVYAKRAASWDRLDQTLPHFEEMPPKGVPGT